MPSLRLASLVTVGSLVGALIVAPQAQANGGCAVVFSGGNGVVGDPYLVTTAAQLTALTGDVLCWDGDYYTQMNDISMAGATWSTGIGTNATPFTGNYEGGGYTISDLTISGSDDRLGLFGNSSGTIANLGFTGTVTGTGTYVGGLVGYQDGGSITNSYTTGAVSGSASTMGGLVGFMAPVGGSGGSITTSYATGSVTSTSSTTSAGGAAVGGLIGYNHGVVTKSFATGTVTLSGSPTQKASVGGLVGSQDLTVRDSYSTGAVRMTGTPPGTTRIGGLLGFLRGELTNSYSTGSVSQVGTYGGLIGVDDGEAPGESGSYWDTQTAGTSTSAAGTGKTSQEMKTLSTFTGLSISNGWNSSSTWGMCSSVNSGYPFLTAFHSSSPCSGGSGSAYSDTETLELAAEPGLNCSSSQSGRRGTWISLPSASQCTLSGDYAGTLLGWSTLPDFPVEIAQRQVDNGWGAYELFDESGRMLGVFIPAGGATFISNSTRLYPIIDPVVE